MRKSTDTILRQWDLLQLIPRHPRKSSTSELHNKLLNEGYDIDKRTTERDLDRLSAAFPITCDLQGRANKWYWQPNARIIEIPGMTPSTALALRLLEDYLKPLLPNSVLELLSPYMSRAKEVIKRTKLNRWSASVMAITRGPTLLPPVIKKDVQNVVYEALLENRRFKVTYASRKKDEVSEYDVNPLGLVFRGGTMYLVATLWSYKNIIHLAVHRMSKPILLDQTAYKVKGFNLKQFVENDKEFSYPRSDKLIKLRVVFTSDAAYHLSESRLSKNQQLITQKDGMILLKATVPDTEDLRWWLRGFGRQCEVLSPESLRDEYKRDIDTLKIIYK